MNSDFSSATLLMTVLSLGIDNIVAQSGVPSEEGQEAQDKSKSIIWLSQWKKDLPDLLLWLLNHH